MPTYEYICSKCNHTFEQSQSIANKPLTICPKELCPQKRWGKGKVKRAIVGGAGLIFKGTRFYTTDYRSENYKEGAKKEAPAAAPPPTAKLQLEKPSPSLLRLQRSPNRLNPTTLQEPELLIAIGDGHESRVCFVGVCAVGWQLRPRPVIRHIAGAKSVGPFFVSFALAAGNPDPGQISPADTSLRHLVPELLAVSCERIKHELFRELNIPESGGNKIYVTIRP